MTRRYLIVADLDEDLLTDRERDAVTIIGPGGRETQVQIALEQSIPQLVVRAVTEVECVDVAL